jgi:hypothetical protein
MQDEEPFPPVSEDVLAVPVPPVVIALREGDDSVELPHKPSIPEIAEAEDTIISRDSPIPVVDQTRVHLVEVPERISPGPFQQKNTIRKSIKQLPEFKYHNSDDVIVRRVVQCVASTDLDIACALLRKDEVYDRLRSRHQTVYNYLCRSLVSAIVIKYQPSEPLDVVVDKSLDGVGQDTFNDYIVFKAMDQNRNGVRDPDAIRVAHKDSR